MICLEKSSHHSVLENKISMKTHYSIIVGSMLGAAEYVADAIAEVLKTHNGEVTIHLQPNIAEIDPNSTWVVCTSTHGAGDLPDNIQPFADSLNDADLSGTKAYIIGLGDSSYDTYCYGAIEMEKRLEKANVELICAPLHIDVLNHPIPEDKAVEWLEQQMQH